MSPIRRSVLAASAPALISTTSLAATSAASSHLLGPASDQEISDLLRRTTLAHEALMRGEVDRFRELSPMSADFTLMTPFGGKPTRGAIRSEDQWQAIGRFFRNGHDATVELVQAYRGTDLVVLVVIERAHVGVGDEPAQDWALRVTLVFRKEQARWLLTHRHADALAGGISVRQAAVLARGPSPR
ncbi:MAG: nuclear transport factor 2 family protein [Lautropia sp.]